MFVADTEQLSEGRKDWKKQTNFKILFQEEEDGDTEEKEPTLFPEKQQST